MVVPAWANTSKLPRRCRTLAPKGKFCLSVLQSLRITFEGKSKIRAQNVTPFPQSTVLVSSSETSWTRQVSVQWVTLSWFLGRSPLESCKLLTVVTSCGEEFPQTCMLWRTTSVCRIQPATAGFFQSPSLLCRRRRWWMQLIPRCPLQPSYKSVTCTSAVLICLREEDENCAWYSKCSRSMHLHSGIVIFWWFSTPLLNSIIRLGCGWILNQ